MPLLSTSIDTRSEIFVKNREDMIEALAEIDAIHEEAKLGGGQKATDRLIAKGKLPARERVALLLDPDAPFMEISPMAGYMTHLKTGGGAIVSIGVKSRARREPRGGGRQRGQEVERALQRAAPRGDAAQAAQAEDRRPRQALEQEDDLRRRRPRRLPVRPRRRRRRRRQRQRRRQRRGEEEAAGGHLQVLLSGCVFTRRAEC